MADLGYCRELGLAEPLAGTGADAVVRWILLEDGGPWGAKTPRDTGLPAPTIAWLLARGEEPGTKVQLIRRPGSRCGAVRKLILAEAPADPSQRRLVELEVELEALPSLDLDAILATAPVVPNPAALWLVCTHGTRDRCCAKWGMPVFEALRRRDPERVWQCSHLGGHRFAPTFLSLPDGLLWGRFDVSKLGPFADALEAGELTELASLRGRCCYPRDVQAAESVLRLRDGITRDTTLELVGVERVGGVSRVEFRYGSAHLSVAVASVALGFSAPDSCGDAPQPRFGFRSVF